MREEDVEGGGGGRERGESKTCQFINVGHRRIQRQPVSVVVPG